MYQRIVLSVLFFIGLTFNQTANADIGGKVSDQAGIGKLVAQLKPIGVVKG